MGIGNYLHLIEFWLDSNTILFFIIVSCHSYQFMESDSNRMQISLFVNINLTVNIVTCCVDKIWNLRRNWLENVHGVKGILVLLVPFSDQC